MKLGCATAQAKSCIGWLLAEVVERLQSPQITDALPELSLAVAVRSLTSTTSEPVGGREFDDIAGPGITAAHMAG